MLFWVRGTTKLKSSDAARVLTDFIREDRSEARIYRNRVENLASSVIVASFAISAFLIGKLTSLTTIEFGAATVLVDAGLVLVLWRSFRRIDRDLILLRKAMKWRQDCLHALEEGAIQDIDVFRNVEGIKPDIKDTDLLWFVELAALIVAIKAAIVIVFSAALSHH